MTSVPAQGLLDALGDAPGPVFLACCVRALARLYYDNQRTDPDPEGVTPWVRAARVTPDLSSTGLQRLMDFAEHIATENPADPDGETDELWAEAQEHAQIVFMHLLEESPSSEAIRGSLAIARLELGQVNNALDTLLAGLALNPESEILRELNTEALRSTVMRSWLDCLPSFERLSKSLGSSKAAR